MGTVYIHYIKNGSLTTLLYHLGICELRSDENKSKNYTRVSITTFEFVIQQIGEEIRKEDTNFRKSISPEGRLLIILGTL